MRQRDQWWVCWSVGERHGDGGLVRRRVGLGVVVLVSWEEKRVGLEWLC